MSKNTTISVAIGLVAIALAAGFYLKNRSEESTSQTEEVAEDGSPARPLVSTSDNWESNLGKSNATPGDGSTAAVHSQAANGAQDPKVRRLFEVSKAQIRLEAGKKNLERMVQDGFAQQLVDVDEAGSTEALVKAFSDNFNSDEIYNRYQQLVQETMTPQEVEELTELFEDPTVSKVISSLNNEGNFSEEEMPKLMSFVEELEKNPLAPERKAALEDYYDASMADQAGRFTTILSAQFDGMRGPLEDAVAKLDPNDNSPMAKDLREKLGQLKEVQDAVSNSEEEMKAELRAQGIKGLAFATKDTPTDELKPAINKLKSNTGYSKSQGALGKATSEATTRAMGAIGTEIGKIDVSRSEKRG